MELDKEGKSVNVGGEAWYVFSMQYRHDGRPFTVEFYARTPDEALARVRSIRTTAEFEGQIIDSFPANAIGRWYVRLSMWLRGVKWMR